LIEKELNVLANKKKKPQKEPASRWPSRRGRGNGACQDSRKKREDHVKFLLKNEKKNGMRTDGKPETV
jgi:hypothetical protein